MKIKKLIFLILTVLTSALFSPILLLAEDRADPGINGRNHGLHLRGALGAGRIFWGYADYGSSSGDLGSGAGGELNLAAMYNYSLLGLELNFMSGRINDLEWRNENTKDKYKSTGTGHYSVLDFKIGAKLFTEPGDMGYTFIYLGKRNWKTVRTEETREINEVPVPSQTEKREAKGAGWITGFRDYSTFELDQVFAIVLQSGLFIGRAPVSSTTKNGADETYPVKKSGSIGAEIASGIAFQKIGLSIIGGLRGEINMTTLKDPAAAATGKDSVFGFGNAVIFIEAGKMF